MLRLFIRYYAINSIGTANRYGSFFPQPIKGVNNISSNFSWDASCDEVSINSYSLNFRVDVLNQDNSSSSLYNFNNGLLSPFTSNVPVMFNSPCGNGWDNSKHIWFGKDETALDI